MKFDSIELALKALKQGESIIVVDDEDRENEGMFIASPKNQMLLVFLLLNSIDYDLKYFQHI
jgi:3,4-dihydroxy-2-butanone 4-phosphate synthase